MTRKTTRRTVLLLIGALAIAALVQSRRLQRHLNRAQQDLAVLRADHLELLRRHRSGRLDRPVESPDGAARHLSADERGYYQRRMHRLEERITFLETAAATVRAPRRPETEPSPDAPGPSPADTDIAAPAAWLSFLAHPDVREALRLRMQIDLERRFDPLLRYFDFDAPSEDTMLTLLIEKQWLAMNMEMVRQRTDLDPAMRRNAIDYLYDGWEDLDAVLYEFLGAEDYEIYAQFHETQPERAQVVHLQTLLIRRGRPALDEQQQHALILALYDERIAVEPPPDPDTADDDPADAILWRHQRRLERAAAILTADQMAVFVPFAEAQLMLGDAALPVTAAP